MAKPVKNRVSLSYFLSIERNPSVLFVSSLHTEKFISAVHALIAGALTAHTLEAALYIGFILQVICFAAYL